MRSMLFVPGDSTRKFEKGKAGPADALILDLEDSIAPDRKDEARTIVREMLSAAPSRQRLYVRVNALDTGRTLGDLAAVLPGRPHGIMLPKAEGGDDVRTVSLWLDGLEAAFGLVPGITTIIPIATETAAAIFGLGTYRGCSPRLEGMMWGAEDLAASVGATENNRDGHFHSPFRLARDTLLMAAAAAGVLPIDTVWTRLEDLDGLARDARAARRDGFAAKAVIHPNHVEPVNAAFTPDEDEVAFSREVVAAFAADPNLGVVRIAGKMIDKPHLRAAEKVLAAAGASGR